MSYTVFIQGQQPIEGTIPLEALADTSLEFHNPHTKKEPEGYISYGGRTTVGIVWLPENQQDTTLIKYYLSHQPELDRGMFNITTLSWGDFRIAKANILVDQPNFRFLSETFKNIRSKFWGMEQTVWYVGNEGDMSVTPPVTIAPQNDSPFILFPLGKLAWYFDETLKEDELTKIYYPNEIRGYEYSRKHTDIPENQIIYQYFSDMITQNGYKDGLNRLVKQEDTGLNHGSTIIYFDKVEDKVCCVHLKHENTKGDWEKFLVSDIKGNDLVITRDIPKEYFLNHWPYKIQRTTTIEGVYNQTILESDRSNLERFK
jgi:hypothetical protein